MFGLYRLLVCFKGNQKETTILGVPAKKTDPNRRFSGTAETSQRNAGLLTSRGARRKAKEHTRAETGRSSSAPKIPFPPFSSSPERGSHLHCASPRFPSKL